MTARFQPEDEMGKAALLKKPNKVLRDTFMLKGNLGWIDLSKLRIWHAEQCTAHAPDSQTWRLYYQTPRIGLREEFETYVAKEGIGRLFHDLAKSLDRSEVKSLYAKDTGIASFLVKIMDWGIVKAYFVDDERTAFVLKDGDTVEVRIVYDQGQERCGELCLPDCIDLFDAALNNWQAWREENGPVRHPLCDVMAQVLTLLSEEAGRMFDDAVAVSRGGRRILTADEVVSYDFGSKEGPKIALHTHTEFKSSKILLGKTHVVRLKPRNKPNQERVRDLLRAESIERYVLQTQAHGCHQCFIEVGESRVFLTPRDTIPPREEEKPADPLFPRREESGISDFESSLNPENAVLDGIAPSPFDDAAGGGIVGHPYEEGHGLDLNTLVYYGPQSPEDVDCTDPAQKPPQRIEAETASDPDVPKVQEDEPGATRARDLANDPAPKRFANRFGRGIAYGAPFDDDACAPPDPIQKAPLEEPSDTAKKVKPES